MRRFKPAVLPGQKVSVYLPADALAAVEPWAAGRARSARLATIIRRHGDAIRQPELSLEEAGILVQLLGPLASLDDLAGAWGRLMDRRREGRLLPGGVEAEALANKVRQFTIPEQLGLLELADRAVMGGGTLRERLIAANAGGRA